MAFCQNCGSELAEGAKFCANCGTPVGQIQKTERESKRKQEFIGSVRKCPNCGAQIPSLTAVCPTCGHEFANVGESEILQKFQEGFTNYEGQMQEDFILSFQVPNTREDLGNFLTLIYSMLNSEFLNASEDSIGRIKALSGKFEEICTKIQTVLPENDPLQAKVIEYMKSINDRAEAENKNAKKRNKFKNKHPILHKIIVGIIIWNILGFAGLEILDIMQDREEKSHKGNTITVSQENIRIPGDYLPYFEVSSDGEVITYDGNSRDFQISFKLKCKKQLPQDLTKGSFYINGEYIWDNKQMLIGTLTSAKPGDIFNVIIDEDTYPSEIKKIDNAKQIVLTFTAEKKETN